MISWLQTRFQKHYQVLFIVLLAVIIVSFVFTIGASPGIGDAERTNKQREFFGIPLTTEQDQSDFSEIAQISAYLQTGRPSFGNNQLQEYAMQRAAALSLADQLGLPPPTDQQLAEYLTTLPAFASQDGRYNPEVYARFLDGVQANPNMSEALISYVLRDDYRANQVNGLVGGPGFVLDAEVLNQQARLKTLWTIAETRINYADFEPEIEPTDEDLEAFYQNNAFRYEVPERMMVNYVIFAADALLDSIVLEDSDVQAYFDQNRSRFQPPAAQGEAPEEVGFEDVRDQVELEMKMAAARTTAVRIASDFAYSLFENGIQPDSEELAAMIQTNDLNMEVSPPFAENQTPVGLPWNRQVVSEAFKLTEDHWFSDPLTVGNDVYLLFFGERLAPYTPEFEAVRSQVLADYTAEMKREQFVEYGAELSALLAEALASGQTFEDAAIEMGLEVNSWADFTVQTPPEGIDFNLLSRLDQIPVGGVSDMVAGQDEGSIVHVVSKYTPEDLDSADDPDLELTRTQIAALNANLTQNLVYSDMIRDELIRSGLAGDQ